MCEKLNVSNFVHLPMMESFEHSSYMCNPYVIAICLTIPVNLGLILFQHSNKVLYDCQCEAKGIG